MEHLEFVVEFHDGSMDWVDPVEREDVVETPEEIRVTVGFGTISHCYTYNRSDVAAWTIRPYSPETTYNPIDKR